MPLPVIWIERIPLLGVYFRYIIAKQGTIFKDICYKQGSQFCSACSPSGLIYYGSANWSFRGQRPWANLFNIIIYYEFFLLLFFFVCLFVCFFFNKLIANFQQKTIAFWYKKIQRLLLKGVLLSLTLQDVGKIFK